MPSRKRDWLERIKAVEREYWAARLAADRLRGDAGLDPTVLGQMLRVRDIQKMADRLEGTYVIRLFAEFESGLREFWHWSRKKRWAKSTKRLIEQVASHCYASHDELSAVHEVREYRNNVVHYSGKATRMLTMKVARSTLCTFFGRVPERW